MSHIKNEPKKLSLFIYTGTKVFLNFRLYYTSINKIFKLYQDYNNYIVGVKLKKKFEFSLRKINTTWPTGERGLRHVELAEFLHASSVIELLVSNFSYRIVNFTFVIF